MDRLRRRAEFLAAAAGARASVATLQLQGHDRRDAAAPRVGFTVSGKIGGAVERNRIRRRLRAAAHEVLPAAGHDGYDYVLVGRRAALAAPYATIVADLSQAVRRLHTSERTRGGPADE
jgi:ribonuclease P protein component